MTGEASKLNSWDMKPEQCTCGEIYAIPFNELEIVALEFSSLVDFVKRPGQRCPV